MSQQYSRTGTQGYTYFLWLGNPILYLQQVDHTSPQPVAQPAVIQPINHIRPLEISTPRAIGHGVLTFTVIEGWENPIWDQLVDIGDSTDLADIFDAVAKLSQPIHVQETILSPDSSKTRTITYHGCKIADLRNGQTLDLTTIQLNKPFDVWYTHSTDTSRKVGGQSHQVASAQNTGEAAQND